MKASGRGLTAGRERLSLRRGLVVVQVALSLVLVAGALLFSRSLNKLLKVNTGFQQEGILITEAGFGRLNVPPERRLAFRKDLLDRIKAIPGVEAVAGHFAAAVFLGKLAHGVGEIVNRPLVVRVGHVRRVENRWLIGQDQDVRAGLSFGGRRDGQSGSTRNDRNRHRQRAQKLRAAHPGLLPRQNRAGLVPERPR